MDRLLISPKDPLMSDTTNCTELNTRGRWCRAAVTPGTKACRHHQDGPVRDWTPDDYRLADAAEIERQAT